MITIITPNSVRDENLKTNESQKLTGSLEPRFLAFFIAIAPSKNDVSNFSKSYLSKADAKALLSR